MIAQVFARGAATRTPTAPPGRRMRLRLLVVEEDPWLAGLLRTALGWEPHTLDATADGSQARELARDDTYDTIVLGLPGRAGLDLCHQLRQDGIMSPILILDTRATVEDVIAGLNGGADDYLAGLADPQELLARIRALSRRYRDDGVLAHFDAPLQAESRIAVDARL
jgi:DNA-binding response OmpR family regulator